MSNYTTFEDMIATREYGDISILSQCDDEVTGYSYMAMCYVVEYEETDMVDSTMTNTDYVVHIGNNEYSFGDDLDAAERFLWRNFAREELNPMHTRYESEFGDEYNLNRKQVFDLFDLGFADDSWHNNIAPTFTLDLRVFKEKTVINYKGRRQLVEAESSEYVEFWFDAPLPCDRETWDGHRADPQFMVCLRKDSDLDESTVLETDDFNYAVAHALALAALPFDKNEYGSKRQIDAENKFNCWVVDTVLKGQPRKIKQYSGLRFHCYAPRDHFNLGLEMVREAAT